jgi:transcriptional regulator with XRE-family HTH domain
MATAPRDFRDLTFGSRLRFARLESGLGLGALARAAGIHPDSLSDYERDRTEPGAFILGRLVDAMRKRAAWVTADWLLSGDTRA